MAPKAKPPRRSTKTTPSRPAPAPPSTPATPAAVVRTTMPSTPSTHQTKPEGPTIMNNNFDNMGGAAREQLEKASQTAYRSYDELSRLQKDNWEALVAASQIWFKGAETVSKGWMTLAQDTMENAASTAKAMVGVKSLREAVDLQTEFAKGNFDKFVAESTKMSETVVKVANDAMEPITARMNVTVEKLFKPLAA